MLNKLKIKFSINKNFNVILESFPFKNLKTEIDFFSVSVTFICINIVYSC